MTNIEFLRTGGGGAAGGAWTLIAETILGAPAANVTFAAIPGTYRTLALLADMRSDNAGVDEVVMWRANADAGANYDRMGFQLTGGGGDTQFSQAIAANEAIVGRGEGALSRVNSFASVVTHWPRYAATDREKLSIILANGQGQDRNAVGDLRSSVGTGWWRNVGVAIASLTYFPALGVNFVAGCQFTLYGIT